MVTVIWDTVREVILEIPGFNVLLEQGLLPELTGQQGQSTRVGTSEQGALTTRRTSPAEAGSIGTGRNTGIVPSVEGLGLG